MAFVLGIDLGGTAVKAGLIPFATLAAPLPSATASTGPCHPPCPSSPPPFFCRIPLPEARDRRTPENIVPVLVEASSKLLTQAGVDWGKVKVVGLGYPGHVKDAGTTAGGAANLSDEWKTGIPLIRLMTERIKFSGKGRDKGAAVGEIFCPPIVLLNDADAALSAEMWAGAARGQLGVVMLTLGTGIGVALALNGQVWSGSRGLVEGGHMVVEKGGRACGCGQFGCLEMYVSASAVKRRAEELGFKKKRVKASDRGKTGCLRVSGDDTTVENRKERSAKIDIERQAQDERGSSHRRDRDSEEESEAEEVPFTSKDVFEAALSSGRNDPPSDSQALQVVEEVADYLGLGCLNLCRIVDPGLILFAGGMSGAGPLFLDMVKARFNFYGWRILPNDVDFKVAALGGDSVGAWGAARAATLSVRGKKDENISKEKK